eukprot:c24915_g2_i1 orf=1-435(-)
MACRAIHFIWKEDLGDPCQLRDHRSSTRGPRSPDYRHRHTRERLNVSHNPPWVKEELRRSGAKDREICVKGEDEVRKVQHKEFQDLTALFDLIKACRKQKDLYKGSRIHADIVERGLLKTEVSLGNALLSMYSNCGALAKAQEVF